MSRRKKTPPGSPFGSTDDRGGVNSRTRRFFLFPFRLTGDYNCRVIAEFIDFLPEVMSLRLSLRILQSLAIMMVGVVLAAAATATTTSATTKSTKSTKSSSNSHKSSSSSSHRSSKSSSKSKKKTLAKATSHGQHGIDEERTREIQQALVREHYLSGEPTGLWDSATKDALTRYQAEKGWQTKALPDSRALIKLGLGPDKKGLLNPDTAVMSSPHELGTQHQLGTPHETRPGGSSQQ